MYNAFSQKGVFKNKTIIATLFSLFVMANVFVSLPLRVAHAEGLAEVKVVGRAEDPSKTTLGVGDQFIVSLDYRASWDDLEIDPVGSCTVNGKDVKSSFQNFNDGTFQLVYTVGEGDADVTAGNISFSCALKDTAGNAATVAGFSEPNTIAISTSGSTSGNDSGTDVTGGTDNTTDTGNDTTGGGNSTTPSISNARVTVSPNTGTLVRGSTLVVTIDQLDHMTDLTMADTFCKINNVEVNNFENVGDGRYTLSHTYTAQDANVPPGQLAFSCAVKNGAGETATLHLTETNTLEVATQADGGNDGLPPAGTFQVAVEPHTGTLHVGDTALVRINDSGGVTDFALNPEGTCTVNGEDVGSSFQAFGDHTYQVTYTVSAQDRDVIPGELSIVCPLKNPSGTTGVVSSFTDNNTLAVSVATTDTNNTNNNTDNNTNNGTTDTNTGGNNSSNDTNSTTGGNVDGNVQGGTTEADNGVLAVTQVDQVRNVATADGTMENGWKWIFKITVPTNEPSVQLKFGNWTHTNGINTISPVNNMRYSSNQAQSTTPVTITASNEYAPAIIANGDLDPNTPGKQIEVVVEMGVPVGSTNGAYTTSYGIKTSHN